MVLCVFKFKNVISSYGKYRTFTKLRKSTQADCPAAFFEEFLKFQRQISQTMSSIASIELPVSSANVNKSKDGSSSVFDEILHDSIDQEKPASKRRNTAHSQHSTTNHNHMRSNDENKKPSLSPPSGLGIQ